MKTIRSAIVLLLSCLGMLTLGSNLAWSKGAAVTTQYSKDFRNLIIQGERPEIVACMVAANQFFKKSPDFEEMRWLDSTSNSAIMNENENDSHLLIRTITLKAEAIMNSKTFFKPWVKVDIQCKQVDEGPAQISVQVIEQK